ncbi:MAG: TolC family protein [Bacteroidota bacterium]|nr:TolC family protein [Bacteroidota bacterium]
MRKLKLTALLFIFGLIATTTTAQENISLSLEEAKSYALENNKEIKNAQLDVLIAKKKIWETTAQGLPQIDAKIAYQNIFKVPTLNFATPVLNSTPNENYPGVFDYEMDYKSSPIKLGTKQSTTIDFTISQLIFSGSYIVGLQTSKVYKQLTLDQQNKSEQNIKSQITNSYYLILILQENANIISNTLKNLSTTEYEIKEMLKEGFVESTDLDQITLTKSNVENGIRTLNQQIAISYDLLKMQLGIFNDSKISLTDNLQNIISNLPEDALTNKKFVVDNNITYQMLETQEKLNKLNVSLKKSEFLPTVAAFYNHQEKTTKADFDFAFPNIVGVNVSIPIFHSAGRFSKVSQAKLELEKTRNQKSQAVQGLQIAYKKAKNDFTTAVANFNNQKTNMKIAQRIYDKTLLKYKEGVSSSMDLTQSNNQLLDSQSKYFQSLLTLLQTKVELNTILNNL